MTRVYDTLAKALGLPALLGDDAANIGCDSRTSELLMTFRGGFEVRIGLADALDCGLLTTLVLHRLMHRAAKERTQNHQDKSTLTPNYPYPWYPAQLGRLEQSRPAL